MSDKTPECLCVDPENCTERVPGYRCKKDFMPKAAISSKERTLLLESTGESRDADYEVVLRFNRAVTEAEYRAIHEHVKRLTGQSAPETSVLLARERCPICDRENCRGHRP